MKSVECGRGVSELISKKWEHKKIGLYYCFEKNNKIYIPFGNRIEIYDKSEYVKLYGDEISEEEHKELSNNADNKLTQYDTECNKNFKPKKEIGISGGRRMTDKEIIKALECCLDTSPSSCGKCPLFNVDVTISKMICSKVAMKISLDLINRQQAEIERLNNNISAVAITLSSSAKETRAEAIKEFARGLRQQAFDRLYVSIDEIDNLVKEMVGEDK